MDHVSGQCTQRLQAVDRRRSKAHRAGVRVVLPNRRYFSDLETKRGGLDQHLRIEDEVVAVFEERNRLEEATRIGAVTRVVLGKMQAKDAILRRGQEPVAQSLPPWHARLRGIEAQPARPEHDVS